MKTSLIILLFVVSFFAVKEAYFTNKQNITLKENNIKELKELDSIKNFYASLVVPCMPDSVVNLLIPDYKKFEWFNYCLTVKNIVQEFDSIIFLIDKNIKIDSCKRDSVKTAEKTRDTKIKILYESLKE